ncbi:ABC transporter permease subunit [Patescibacteria group bacterium]
MFTIFWRTIKDRKTSLIVYCLGAVLVVWMFIAMFPTIQEQSENFAKLAESYPEGFMAAFGIEQMSFDTIESFLSLEHYSILFPIMIIFLLLGLAGAAIAREVEKGTIENLLSKPISRTKVFFGKYLAGIFALVLFIIFGVFSTALLCEISGIEYVLKAHALVGALSFFFGWAVLSISFMFSTIFSERNKTHMASGMILLGMYLANVAASLLDKISDLKYISLFYYFDYNTALLDSQLELLPIIVLGGVAIICTAIGVVWFNKRDIAV